VTIRIERGEANAALGRWDRAAADFGDAVGNAADDQSRNSGMRLAKVRLAMGDQVAYRKACADMLVHLRPTDDPSSAYSVAWTYVLAPDAVADGEAVVRLAEQAVKEAKNDAGRHICLQTLAAASYRAGRFADALQHLDDGLNAHGKGGNALDWLFLALIHQRLGHADEARTWLDKAVRWIDASTPAKPADDAFGARIYWQTWLALRVLRREAESALQAAKAGP